ncbi:MAG: tRNA pseudouridine(54/55) synthase Pus10 [Promethearchaeati archaeon SRVP18_Atabeyarchaeia-1]
MEIIDKTLKLLENYPLCDNCLGRQFALLGVGLDNKSRGKTLKNVLLMRAHLLMENEGSRDEATRVLRILASKGNYEPAVRTLEKLVIAQEGKSEKCFICSNILDGLDELAGIARDSLTGLDFKTFLVGSTIPPDVMEREDQIRSTASSNWCESLKREVNREIGKRLKLLVDKEPNFDSPDLTISVSPFNKNVLVRSNPLFIGGRYRKLVRGIPQATWLCRKCRGSGCPDCNWSGRMYENSVQDFVSKPFLEATNGAECKFHGAGREDIDARMLGSGRPFILEVKEPKTRSVDFQAVAERIRNDSQDRVEVLDLRPSSRDELRKIKTMATKAEKTYRAIVAVERDVSEEDVKRLTADLSGALIKQRTPLRVLHRRADKVRIKKVYNLQINLISPRKMEVTVTTQGGLYVKELVSGDENRTAPSFSQILAMRADCQELDVVDVADQFI